MEWRRGPCPHYTFPFSQRALSHMERRRGLRPLLHFSLRSTGLIPYGAEEGALPPTTLFPPVNGPDLLWSGGGGFAPYYTFPFGQRALSLMERRRGLRPHFCALVTK